MSDHDWTREHVAAFVMGGLAADETDRLESHLRDCPDCAAAVAAARRVDRGLDSLFADVRPGLGLEDGAIRSIRSARRRPLAMSFRLPRLAIAAGILLVLCIVGAMAGAIVGDGRLPLPGNAVAIRGVRKESEPDAALGSVDNYMDGVVTVVKNSSVPGLRSYEAREGVGKIDHNLAVRDSSRIHGQTNGPGQAIQFGFAPPSDGRSDARMMANQGISGGISGINGGISGGINGGIGGGISGMSAANAQYGLNYRGDATKAGGGDKNEPQVSGGSTALGTKPALDYYYQVPNLGNQPTATGIPPALKSNSAWFFPTEHRLKLTADPKEVEQNLVRPQTDKPGLATAAVVPPEPAAAAPESATRRVVIRSGDMEFEVNSFDAAVATVTKLVTGLKGAFVATVNSDKLANGKVRGSITVRTPPEHLDTLVLDLRRDLGATGELKGMKIGSQDITKQYTDLESRLRAARAMEQRLLQMIKDGKGEIKQLLEAERELGNWRTKIEEFEGELRYYGNLVSLATLTITLSEKKIRAAAAVTESERVQAGVEVEDVDKAYQQTLTAVAEAKGRVVKSDLKQLAAGQFNASLQFEVPPDAAPPIRDRLRQIGRVARLEIDRAQHAVGETPPADVKVKRGDTLFLVQLYNLSNVAARESTVLQVAAPDVRAAYQALRDAAAKAAARVLVAQLNEQDAQNVTAQIDIEVRRGEDGAFRIALESAGEIVSRQVARAAEGDNTTDTKVQYRATLIGINRLSPRETATLQVAVPDVRAAYQSLREAAGKATARVLVAQLNEQDAQNVTAQIDVEVRRADEGTIRAALETAGEVVSRQVSRALEANNTTDSKVLYRTTLSGINRLSPRETTSLTLEVQDVDQALAAFGGQVAEAKGRQLSAQSTRERSGRVTAQASYEVPLASVGLAERFKAAGAVRGYQSTRDPQAPAGKYATAKIDVILVSGDQIVSADDGLWPQVRRGLSYSVAVLLTSVTWVVFGLCVVLPWGLVGYVGYRVFRRAGRSATPAAVNPTTPG